jgi:iron complex outermembrane recepter protein
VTHHRDDRPLIRGMLCASVSSACLLLAMPAMAQDATQLQTEAGRSTTTLDEIIVTAQRREERIQDVPAAISAFTGETLESAGVVNTRDLELVTPALAFTQASYAPQPSIRGIGTRGVNPGDEQVVPVYVDGVYQPFVVGGLFELSNVDRIEVLRGPQGTLLGRNATGGAINIITERPQPGLEGHVILGYGSYNEHRATGYITGGNDQMAASLSVDYLEDDGYVYDVINDRDFAKIDSIAVRGQVEINPDENTTITLTGSYYDRYDDTSLANFALNGNTIGVRGVANPMIETGNYRSSQTPGLIARLTTDQTAFSATIVRRFADFDVTSISGYSDNSLSYLADADMAPGAVIRLSAEQYDQSFTQELFASSTTDSPFQWTIGLFYFDNEAGQNPRNLNGGLIFTDTRATAWAAYAQGSYDITDRLTFTAGGRYNFDDKSAQARNGTGTQVLPFVEKSWENFSPSASLDFEITPETRIYGRYATAFKAGVFNATGFARVPVEPEEVETFEIGIKSDPFPWMRTNFAAFTTDYKNIQIFARSPDPTNASVILQNAASATITGVEGDVFFRPVSGLNVIISAAVLDAKYEDFPLAQSFRRRADGAGNDAIIIDAGGNRLTRVPEFTASISADYTIAALGGDVTFAGNVYHNGGYSWGVDDRIEQDSYQVVNATITWVSPDDRYEVALWGKNLGDSDHLLTVSSSVLGDQAAYARPRTFGVRLTGRF